MVAGFTMSTGTRAALHSAMEPLTVEQRSELLDAVAALSAEVQMYSEKVAMEKLRHQWSGSLRTMLLMM